MDTETWKALWQVLFYAASGLFYLTVAAVAVRGAGDVGAMVRRILRDRKPANRRSPQGG